MLKILNEDDKMVNILSILLLVVFILAFLLNFVSVSFEASKIMGVEIAFQEIVNIVTPLLPYFVPALLDVFLLIAVGITLRNSRVGENGFKNNWLEFLVIFVTTFLVIFLNLYHYNVFESQSILEIAKGAILSVLVPSVVLVSNELIKKLLDSKASRNKVLNSISQLKNQLSELMSQKQEFSRELEQIQNEIETLTHNRTQIETQIEVLKSQKKTQTDIESIDIRLIEALQIESMLAMGIKKNKICEIFEMTYNTVDSRLAMVNGNGLKHRLEKTL